MNNLTFTNGAYRLEKANGEIFEGVVSNLIAHFKIDTITITDRVTLVKLPIITAQSNNLQIGGQTKTFEQIKTIIETELAKGGGASTADAVSYDNSKSGFSADNVQDALDEVGANLGEIDTQVQGHETALHNIPTLTESDWETLRTAGGVQSEVSKLTSQSDRIDLCVFGEFSEKVTLHSSYQDNYAKLGKSVLLESGKTYEIVAVLDNTIAVATYAKVVNDKNSAQLTYFNVPANAISNKITYTPTEDVYVFVGYSVRDAVGVTTKISTKSLSDNVDRLVYGQYPFFSLNPSKECKIIHHLNVESGNTMPSQSLFDISYARKLGHKFIEANIHRCSDGVFVVKHGINDTIGNGVVCKSGSGITSSTRFDEITSTQLRSNVTYNSVIARYADGFIPTLDEFCQECNRQGIGIMVQCTHEEVLQIVRKYLTDDMIIAYALSKRGDFKGLITHWVNVSSTQQALDYANSVGHPYILSIANYSTDATFRNNKALVSNIIKSLHEHGYLASTAYLSSNDIEGAFDDGFDIVAVTDNQCRQINVGNHYNIHNSSEHISMVGATFNQDKTISMPNGSAISINGDSNEFEQVSITINCVGDITIIVGNDNDKTNLNIVSDGKRDITFNAVAQHSDNLLNIVANSQTTIRDIHISTSII